MSWGDRAEKNDPCESVPPPIPLHWFAELDNDYSRNQINPLMNYIKDIESIPFVNNPDNLNRSQASSIDNLCTMYGFRSNYSIDFLNLLWKITRARL
ncbi:hypothetical protein TetV_122 [Tetraselmis virus 1]|uniref:Uncharacterized protein n=1 Tax=Tetraselmis virus 1 TaxID=2060617 RepID=A0A2P0VMT2_9VIRU|nr:hypothetical protein QJ968_gp122 [Tetraselmis virus 1]AUF82214.1 hypothetical protein TetV_122 [Tetraselmis virus 1]